MQVWSLRSELCGRSSLGKCWLVSFGTACLLIVCWLGGSGSSALAAVCPNEAIREEQGVAYLPDCMAFE